MNKRYIKPDIKVYNIDLEHICAPHSNSGWKPGDGKPPWAKHEEDPSIEYRNNLWEK